MKLKLVCVGRLGEAWLREGVADYSARIARYLPFETIELKEEQGDPRRRLEEEGRRILARLAVTAFTIVLDERGRQLPSAGVAELLEKHMVGGTAEVVLVIGGAYGLSDAVRQRGNLLLSLSALTLPHQLARLLLTEQLYRGLTIIRHEPYHNR
ncbi:MAG TPA: 50S rRNA methyltransferase [Desulfuromonas sp.]|nr:50S rRNA methyltransferase [Desulfuromonas sp.]